MDGSISIQFLINVGCCIMGIWGFIKVIKEIRGESNLEHDKRQRWDRIADIVEKKEKQWDEGLEDVYNERKQIVERYDGRLDEQDAKIQQLYTMIVMLMRSQNAILEALIESNIGNGEIKEMHKELNTFITEQIGV